MHYKLKTMTEYFKITENNKITCIGISKKENNSIVVKEILTINDNNYNPFENGEYKIINKIIYLKYLEKFKYRKVRRLSKKYFNFN